MESTDKSQLDAIINTKDELERQSKKNIDSLESELLLSIRRNESLENQAEIENKIREEQESHNKKMKEWEEKSKRAHDILEKRKKESLESKANREKKISEDKELHDKKSQLENSIVADREQKSMDEAAKWEDRRNKIKNDAAMALNDPTDWLKGFLIKKASESLHYAVSKKRRLEVANEKEKQEKLDKENDDAKLDRLKELEKIKDQIAEAGNGIIGSSLDNLVIEASGVNSEAIVESIDSLNEVQNEQVESIDSLNEVQNEQLRQDSDQWRADQRVSASEEATAALTGSESGSTTGGDSVGVERVKKPAFGGLLKKPMDGIKGILGNIMKKFGAAGKFLLSLGTKFLMPLITTPIGWGILAGLAVGGLVFAYWDDITAFISSMFKSVKSMFSKVVSKISGMFSAVGNAIKEVISFFNPMNLLPMIAKALLPADMYGAVSSFFGGDNAEEIESKDKKATLEKETAIGDKMESELSSAKSDQLNLGKSLSSKNVIAAEKDGEVITIRVGDKFEGTRLTSPNHANWKLKQAGYKVLSPEETNAIMDENEKDIKLKQFDLDVQVGREVKLIDDIAALDESVATGKKKNDKPGNVVADLVRAGTAEYNVFGDSTIKNWPALQKLDYESLEKVLAFDDWGDKTKKGILGIMNSKKQLIGANDLEPIKPNEVSVLRKDEMMSGALQKGMDNNILQGSGNNTPAPSQNIVSAPVTNNNNTTIKKERTHDTDVTNMNLNKSAMMFPEEEF